MKSLTLCTLLAVVAHAGPVLAAEPTAIHLQSLVTTSGGDGVALFDGDRATGWRPEGDPASEGVLFRFEAPMDIRSIEISSCSKKSVTLVDYQDGRAGVRRRLETPKDALAISTTGRPLRSLFLRIEEGEDPCLAEVVFKSGAALPVRPPRVVRGTVTTSSTLAPIDAYHPGYLFDGRLDFGWVEGAKGTGAGESITVTLEQPQQITALELWNGYQRSEDHFQKNARVKSLSVSVDGSEPVTLKVQDAMGPQKLQLPKAVTGKVITLKVEAVTPGKSYPDMVLSELRLWDGSGPLGVRTPDRLERKTVLEKAIAGTPLSKITNRHLRNYCTEDGESTREGQLKLRTDHTIVWYGQSDDWGSLTAEVLDGTWVVASQNKRGTTVDLFARKHRTEESVQPYGGAERSETHRIAGGKLELLRVEELGPAAFSALVEEWRTGPASNRVNCIVDVDEAYRALVSRQGVVVRGKALTELLW